MNDQSIEEGNRIIAESRGWKWENGWAPKGSTPIKQWTVPENDTLYGKAHCNHKLYFDSDWNWIMAAIDEIETIDDKKYFSEIRRLKYDKQQHVCRINSFRHIELPLAEGKAITKINSVFLAVIEFIKWHNIIKRQINDSATNYRSQI